MITAAAPLSLFVLPVAPLLSFVRLSAPANGLLHLPQVNLDKSCCEYFVRSFFVPQ